MGTVWQTEWITLLPWHEGSLEYEPGSSSDGRVVQPNHWPVWATDGWTSYGYSPAKVWGQPTTTSWSCASQCSENKAYTYTSNRIIPTQDWNTTQYYGAALLNGRNYRKNTAVFHDVDIKRWDLLGVGSLSCKGGTWHLINRLFEWCGLQIGWWCSW